MKKSIQLIQNSMKKLQSQLDKAGFTRAGWCLALVLSHEGIKLTELQQRCKDIQLSSIVKDGRIDLFYEFIKWFEKERKTKIKITSKKDILSELTVPEDFGRIEKDFRRGERGLIGIIERAGWIKCKRHIIKNKQGKNKYIHGLISLHSTPLGKKVFDKQFDKFELILKKDREI